MNPGDLKLLELLTVDDAAGTLHFAHRRMLLFDADAMGLLCKELIETLGLERARRILTRFGYACGYRDALTSREVVDWSNLAEWWAAGPRLHTLEGVVGVHIRRAKIDQAHSLFDVEAEWRNSYEAEQHRTHTGAGHWHLPSPGGEQAMAESRVCGSGDAASNRNQCATRGSAQSVMVKRRPAWHGTSPGDLVYPQRRAPWDLRVGEGRR